MSFYRALADAFNAGNASTTQFPDHVCLRCQQPMMYKGPHAIRTGGLSQGWGFAADLFLGARDEVAINQALEKNIVVHVFMCSLCGSLDLINDPQKGF